MKQLFALIIIGISLALGINAIISMDAGYVRISLGHWLFESNVWVLLFLNLCLISAIFALVYTVGKAHSSSRFLRRWLGQSGEERAKLKTRQGLVALLEGNWPEARRLLSRSANRSDMPLVNYLAAAHAANESGNDKEADHLLQQAYKSSKESEFAIGIAQAQIQLQKNELELCLATLVRLRQQSPHHPYLLKLLKSVYTRLEDWQQLVQLIPLLVKHAGVKEERLSELEKHAWQSLFIQKREELERQQKSDQALSTLSGLWQQVPDKLQFHEDLIEIYAQQLVALNHSDDAERLLRKTLNKRWSDKLILFYGCIGSQQKSEQLITAENWLKQRPNNAAIMLTLGRLALRNELWGKAWEYLQASHKLQPSQQTYAELCRLDQHLNEDQKQSREILEGLLTTLSLPNLPLPK